MAVDTVVGLNGDFGTVLNVFELFGSMMSAALIAEKDMDVSMRYMHHEFAEEPRKKIEGRSSKQAFGCYALFRMNVDECGCFRRISDASVLLIGA